MSKIYCSNCGKLIPEDSNFCRYCGAAQHGGQAAVYRAEAPMVIEPTAPKSEVLRMGRARKRQLKQREVIERRHLAPEAVWLFFINYNIRLSIVLPMFAVGIWWEPTLSLVAVGYFVLLFVIAYLVYNYFYFSVTDLSFRSEYGIIHKKEITVPFEQIQNVNIRRTLIDRMLGIAKIDIETAGTGGFQLKEVVGGTRSRSEGFIPAVTLEDARHIHDLLLAKKEYAHKGD